MAMAKYDFAKVYGHPDPVIDKNMKTIYKYALSASEAKSEKVAYFLERFIQKWKDSVPEVKEFPWQETIDKQQKKPKVVVEDENFTQPTITTEESEGSEKSEQKKDQKAEQKENKKPVKKKDKKSAQKSEQPQKSENC